MPKRKAETPEKDEDKEQDSTSMATGSITMADIGQLLDEHKCALVTDVKAHLETLGAKLDNMQATGSDRGQRGWIPSMISMAI